MAARRWGASPRRPARRRGQRHAGPQPVEVVTTKVGHVVAGVLEVDRVTACSPSVPRRRVVVSGQADGQREKVGSAEREVDRVICAEAASGRHDLERAAAVVVDERHDLVEDPRLVRAVTSRSFLDREVARATRSACRTSRRSTALPGRRRSARRPRRPCRCSRSRWPGPARTGTRGAVGPSGRRR